MKSALENCTLSYEHANNNNNRYFIDENHVYLFCIGSSMARYWKPACIEIGIGLQYQAKIVPILYALDPMHQLNFT